MGAIGPLISFDAALRDGEEERCALSYLGSFCYQLHGNYNLSSQKLLKKQQMVEQEDRNYEADEIMTLHIV